MKPLEREIEDARRRLQVIGQGAGSDPDQRRLQADAAQELAVALETMRTGIGTMQNRYEEMATALTGTEARCRHYRVLFETAPDASVVTDPGCIIREANRRAAALFGADSDALIGTPLLRFIVDEEAGAFAAWLCHPEEKMAESGWETLLLAPNREPIRVSVSVSHLYDDQGAHAGYTLVFHDITLQKERDITDQKHSERVLELSNRKLHLLASVTRHDILNQSECPPRVSRTCTGTDR